MSFAFLSLFVVVVMDAVIVVVVVVIVIFQYICFVFFMDQPTNSQLQRCFLSNGFQTVIVALSNLLLPLCKKKIIAGYLSLRSSFVLGVRAGLDHCSRET